MHGGLLQLAPGPALTYLTGSRGDLLQGVASLDRFGRIAEAVMRSLGAERRGTIAFSRCP
jgi:hypothetical protein